MEVKNLKKFSEILITYRIENNLTQEQLANILECSKSTIVKIEKNTYTGNGHKLFKQIHKLNLKKKDFDFIEKIKPNLKNIERKKNISPLEIDLDMISRIIESSSLIKKIEDQEIKIQQYEEKLKHFHLIETNDIKTTQRIRAAHSDMTNTSQIIKLMWKLKDESSKYFSELELMLKMNKIEENEKMKKGLISVGESLIKEGEALIKLAGIKEGTINII